MEDYGTFFYFPHVEKEVYEKFGKEPHFPIRVGIVDQNDDTYDPALTIRKIHPEIYMKNILIQGTDLGKAITQSVKRKRGLVKAREEYPFYESSKSNPRYIQTVLGDYNGHFLHKNRLSNLLLAIDDIGLECYCFAHEIAKFPSKNFSWHLLGVVINTDKNGEGRVGLDENQLNHVLAMTAYEIK
ncbi:hypothetical protein [uncultured Desulfobacter sp.]|uniref:hypothetical protein n=1 Tax=uncultured Desulfobacter sp. TaxID=240139 RepID=UPI002AA67F22|nr:hypothetical protein [uncultured Desulfobacter sp.]